MKKNGDISLKYELVFNKKKQLQERNRRPQMLNAQYADLDETLSKKKANSQVQSGTTRKVNRSAAEIHRLENPRSSPGTNFRNLEKASALLKIFKRQKISCLALSSRQL